MWQVLVGPSFFFFGNVDQLETLNDAASRPSRVTHGSLSKPPSLLVATLVADEASGSVRLSLSGGDAAEGQWYRQCHVPDGQVVALREHVVSVMEAFAGLAAKGSTGDECSKLVEVLFVGALEEDIVLLLSPALRRLLSVVPAVRPLSLSAPSLSSFADFIKGEAVRAMPLALFTPCKCEGSKLSNVRVYVLVCTDNDPVASGE
jgi:hypothetical protein